MTITIFDEVEQGTPEWYAVRMGIPTASMFSTVMASGRGGGDSKTRATYMRKLAGEALTGEPMENFTNGYVERGKRMEAEARDYYAMQTDTDPEQVGFIRYQYETGATGGSPDALIGNDGLLEIKTKAPHLLIETIESDRMPPEYRHQQQGLLWLAKREWCDLCCYWPKMPKFIKRTYRDEDMIQDIKNAVYAFNDELALLVERMRAISFMVTL